MWATTPPPGTRPPRRRARASQPTGTHGCAPTAHALGSQAVAFARAMPSCVVATYEYSERAMAMESVLCAKLQALPPSEFEGVLHPVFEEDEWKLIAVGGLLGLFVGVFQAVYVFGSMGGGAAE